MFSLWPKPFGGAVKRVVLNFDLFGENCVRGCTGGSGRWEEGSIWFFPIGVLFFDLSRVARLIPDTVDRLAYMDCLNLFSLPLLLFRLLY
ncbi:unnamed protein product [Cercopithifilaria johnstoni]|uniref:Uncharacterized protein n=1 Tax=Cercopithifilaria johnstoni TaxID=2874296 RepID=A0A8J2M2H0_9BILA|nr:unnamed protein product [Cercopithifilaria johnstoni]